MKEELADLSWTVSVMLIFCAAVLGYLYVYHYDRKVSSNHNLGASKMFDLPELPRIKLTVGQLLQFNGTRSDGRILVALKGKIYDVSCDFPEFSPSGALSHIAGKDMTDYLQSLFTANKKDVKILDCWEAILGTNYSCVGILIDEFGKPLNEKVESTAKTQSTQNADVVEKDIVEDIANINETKSDQIISNTKSKRTLNEVLTAETLLVDIVPQKCLQDLDSEGILNGNVSEC